MGRRRRNALILLSLAALFLMGWLTRGRWLPTLLDGLTTNATLINALSDLVAIFGILVPAALALLAYLGFARRPASPEAGRLIQPVALESLRARFQDVKGSSFAYIDRGATGDYALRPARLVITGDQKVGKTREAVELIGRCLEPRHIPPARLFRPTPELRGTDPGAVAGQVGRDVGDHGALLLLVDDLPRAFQGDELDRLAAALAELERCGPLHVVATARDDQMTDHHRDWLAAQGFTMVPLPRWSASQIGALAGDGLFLVELPDDPGGRTALAEGSDGTPELTRLTLLGLAEQGRADRAAVEATQRKTYREMWLATREELIRREPVAAPLLRAIAVFYAARVTPYTALVLALAARRTAGLWRAWRLRAALALLEGNGVGQEDARLLVRDYIAEAEAVEETDGCQELATFLLSPRQQLHNLWLVLPPSSSIWPREDLLVTLALALARDGNAADAARLLAAANRIRPLPVFYNNRGVDHADHGREAEALADFNEAIYLNPVYATAYINRGSLYRKQSRPDQALSDYNEAIRLDPTDATAYNNRGNLHDDHGREAEALADYNEAIRLNPAYATVLYNRGSLHAEHGRADEALTDFTKAIRLNPTDAVAFHNRGSLYANHGHYAEALADYSEAIRLDPADANTFYNRGILLRIMDRSEEAARDLEAARQLGDNSGNLQLRLAGCYRDLGRLGEMEHHLALARERIEPDDLYNRACLEAIAGNAELALDLLAQALAAGKPSSGRAWVRRDPDWKPLRDHPRFRELTGER